MQDQDNLTSSTESRHPVTIVSWVALAVALVLVGIVAGTSLDLREFLPFGNDAAGLPAIGEEAPDFSAIDSDGRLVSLSDFVGQPVWLNFWGSWCPPCRAETPDMVAAYNELKKQGITLVAVSLEEPSSDAFDYAERTGMDFVVLSDPDREAIEGKYRVRSFPTHIFIDGNGIVRDIKLYPLSTNVAVKTAESILDDSGSGT